jgi:anti-sigma B factor antagonist
MELPRRGLPLSVDQQERDGVVVVTVAGELDLATAPRLTSQLDALRRNGRPPRVLVDLGGLEFCDSTGLRALLGAATEFRAAGGRLAISAGEGPVPRLLAITGASEWLDVHPDPAAARASLLRR